MYSLYNLCILSADPALRVERRGSPLFPFLGLSGSPGSCCAFATLRAVFPDWVHSPRFLPGCGRVHVQGCRDGHFVFASRLGSLSTVFTWLRSRACAGMQGLGMLALVVVAPCGFAAHVASEEAVLSSPLRQWDLHQRQKYDPSCEICSVPGARAPTTYLPEPKPLDPSPSPCTFPHPTGHPSKNAILPLDPPPRALVPSPTPQCFKKNDFS